MDGQTDLRCDKKQVGESNGVFLVGWKLLKTLKKLTLPRFFAWFLPTHFYLQKPRFLNFRFKICKSVLFPKYGTCRSLCLSFVFVFVFGVAFCLQIGEDINGKKTLSLGYCPNEGVGGVYPCPIFLALFQEVHFWSIKRVYIFKNTNVLNFKLLFRLLIYLPPLKWLSLLLSDFQILNFASPYY